MEAFLLLYLPTTEVSVMLPLPMLGSMFCWNVERIPFFRFTTQTGSELVLQT